MSGDDLRTAIEMMAASMPRPGYFAGPKSEAAIVEAEDALELSFPPTYRAFVQRFGAGSIGAFEIYGVTEDLRTEAIPNAIWLTLVLRRELGLPQALIAIGSTGDGDYYCLEAPDQGREGRVLVFRSGALTDAHTTHADFGEYLLSGLQERV